MTQEMHQAAYRGAFDSASVELSEILTQFEQLRLRKEQIEKMVDALKPLVQGADQVSAPASPAADTASSPEQQGAYTSAESNQHSDGPTEYHFMKVAESAPSRFQPAASAWPSAIQRH